MRSRLLWLLPLLGFGCHLIDVDTSAEAERLWQDGQAAMQAGHPDQAIACYEQSLAQDALRTQNHLSLAAAFVQKGDTARACRHLGQFLETHPEHKNARLYYAELLLQLKQLPAAQEQFERVVAVSQEEQVPDLPHLVHCHSRLLEVAEGLEDDYHAHLHRGIGMYLLARARARLTDPDGPLSTEALLCKAAGELAQARGQRPQEARPCLYLYSAWRQLAQQQQAQRWLREASRAAPFSYLTPAEHAQLQLAISR
jgi:tetratricopeptide (TPR) repeat protein